MPDLTTTASSTTPTPAAAPATAATPAPDAVAPAPAAVQQQNATPANSPTAQGAPAAEIVLKLPEGVKDDHPTAVFLKQAAKDLGLSQAQAQALFERDFAAAQKAQKDSDAAWAQQTKDWEAETRADPEIGGQRFESSKADVQRFMARFGTAALTELLNKTGLGVHKEVFRVLAKVGQAMREDSVGGGSGGSGPESQEAVYQRMYPKSPELWKTT